MRGASRDSRRSPQPRESRTGRPLLGAADALLDAMGGEFKPFERRLHEETVAATRSRLAPHSFDAMRAEGKSLSLEQAAEYALETGD